MKDLVIEPISDIARSGRDGPGRPTEANAESVPSVAPTRGGRAEGGRGGPPDRRVAAAQHRPDAPRGPPPSSDGDDRLSARVTPFELAERFGRVDERIRLPRDRRDVTGLDEIGQAFRSSSFSVETTGRNL